MAAKRVAQTKQGECIDVGVRSAMAFEIEFAALIALFVWTS